MSDELTLSRDYLHSNRRLIIGRAIAAAAVGATPIPVVEEWLTATIRRRTVERIAESHQVDLDDEAIKAIADGADKPPSWHEMAGGAFLTKFLGQSMRKLFVAVVAARRTQAAARYFMLDTLFDHYCARLHVGLGLDGAAGKELRAAMDRALAETPGGLARRMFRRGVVAAARASVRAPIEIADTLTAGWLRKLLGRGSDEVKAVIEVDEALERQLQAEKGFLGRAATAVELQLAADNNPYVDRAIDTFDRLWRERRDDS